MAVATVQQRFRVVHMRGMLALLDEAVAAVSKFVEAATVRMYAW